MNIVLIGMRGTGKTTVAQKLAQKLNLDFIEMDWLIEQQAGLKTAEIVQKHGWEHFRDLESEVAKDISDQDNKIISAGGGVILRPENIKALKARGKLFLLTASVDTMLKRIGKDSNRPSLSGKKSQREDIEATWHQRKKLYEDAADEIVDTEGKTADEVVKEILTNLEDAAVY